MHDHLNVAALVFPGMDKIDLTGPFAVLSRLPDSTVRLVWKDTNPIRDYRGLRLIPDARFAAAGAASGPAHRWLLPRIQPGPPKASRENARP